MLVLQTTPQARRFCELRRDALMSTENHQGGLNDSTDESDGKIFEVNNSSRCRVKQLRISLIILIPNGLPVPTAEGLSGKFKPENETVWCCNLYNEQSKTRVLIGLED